MTEADKLRLQEVRQLLKAKQRAEARQVVQAYLKRYPDDAEAWYLYSFCAEGRAYALEAAARAARLAPENAAVAARLARLRSTGVARPATRPVNRPPKPAVYPEDAASPRASSGLSPGTLAAAGLGGVVLLCMCGLAFSLLWARLLPAPADGAPAVAGAPSGDGNLPGAPPAGGVVLPPTWTMTPSPVPSNTPVPSSTPVASLTPSATPTLSPTPRPSPSAPEGEMLADMIEIQQEVADLRGLAPLADLPQYLIDQPYAEGMFEEMFFEHYGSREALEDTRFMLSTVGLIKPTYDLYNAVVSSFADGIGGFYLPDEKEMYVIGDTWGGMERYIYSHEYGHALVDQHYDFGGQGVYPVCTRNAQECKAIMALVEGDATLVMNQWLYQYGTPEDINDLLVGSLSAAFDWSELPEEFPPPYVEQDSYFPYDYGAIFVETIYNNNNGSWAAINAIYDNLPTSTEQIMHPQKYIDGEQPRPVAAPDLSGYLGEGWALVGSDVFGEWTSFLLLAYGADIEATIAEERAFSAAAGWGGDQYQVWRRAGDDAAALAAHWVWDTPEDANEWYTVLGDHLSIRYRGGTIASDAGRCWSANASTACVYVQGDGVLWLLGPTTADIEAMLRAYPAFP